MPLLITCQEVQADMRLAEAFMWKGRMMLPGGKVLTREDVDILRRKYADVMLKIGDPVLDSLAKFEDDGKEREVASTVQQAVSQSLNKVQERLTSRSSFAKLDFNAVRNSVSSVIEYLKANPVSAALINRNGDANNYLSDHAGAVFYLAMVLGSAVRDYVVTERTRQTAASNLSAHIAMDLLPLGLGTMFMDLGMFPLKHIFTEGYELTAEDRQAIREHPAAGADQIPDSLPAGVKMIVRTHHENMDSTGYPTAMRGETLHIFTRIVRICDAFEAATAKSVYKQAKSPARVIWEMCAGPYRKCYDPVLMKVFRSLIQPFPIGAKLRLTDGRTAVVVRYNRKEPFQPTVIIAFNERGERLPSEQIGNLLNVGEENDLRLAAFGDEDLSYVYEIPTQDSPEKVGPSLVSLIDTAYP